MADGIYSLRLLFEPTVSTALVVLRDGCVDGGDAERIYRGVFTREADRIRGTLTVSRWHPGEPGQPAMLSPEEPVEIALSGTSDAEGFHLVGPGPRASVVEVNGQRVAVLADGRHAEAGATRETGVEAIVKTAAPAPRPGEAADRSARTRRCGRGRSSTTAWPRGPGR